MGEKQGRIVLANVRGVWSANRKPASRRSEYKQRSLKPHVLQEDFWTTLVDDVRGPSRSKANRDPVGSVRFAHSPVENSSQLIRLFPRLPRYCRFACSALASFRMVMSESVSSTSTYARAGISGWLNRAHSRISLIREVTMGVRYSG